MFRREEVVSEITEADRVTNLESIQGGETGDSTSTGCVSGTRWGYGLANGTSLWSSQQYAWCSIHVASASKTAELARLC